MCEPENAYFRVDDLRVHNIAQRADKALAIDQHRKLSSLITSLGHEVVLIRELDNHPNSVFVKDPVFCTPYGYVKLRMGLESRRGEEEWLSKVLNEFGMNCIGDIKAPATAEGGDVIITESVIFVGLSSRTNQEGVNQISSILSRYGYDVRNIPVPSPYLHLGGAMTYLGGHKILCVDSISSEHFKGFELLKVPSGNFISGNVISLLSKKIIAERTNNLTIDVLRANGYELHEINLSEFVKGTGGPTCLLLNLF